MQAIGGNRNAPPSCGKRKLELGERAASMALTQYSVDSILTTVATVVSGDFEWDGAKAEANREKHGISFDEAALALVDPNEVVFADAGDADRVLPLVVSPRARILLVVTTERGARTRIISARKADPNEQRTYHQA